MNKPQTAVQIEAAKMQAEGKKVVTFILKQKYFDAIMAGRKVQEFREVRPSTYNKLIQHDSEGFDIEDEYGNALPVHYDAILFYVGYNKDRDSALVEVKDAHTEVFVDENNEVIEFEVDGGYWQASQVVYDLGRIIATDIHKHGTKQA